MMKFREDRISELEQLVKSGGTDDTHNLVKQKDSEIQVRQDVGSLKDLTALFNDYL